MVDITIFILILGGGISLVGLKYLLFKCDAIAENHEQIIQNENRLDEEPPPKYEDYQDNVQ